MTLFQSSSSWSSNSLGMVIPALFISTVTTPKCVLRLLKCRSHARTVGDIHGHGYRFAPSGYDLVGLLLYQVGAPRREYHLGTSLRQHGRKMTAETAGSASDQSNLSLQGERLCSNSDS